MCWGKGTEIVGDPCHEWEPTPDTPWNARTQMLNNPETEHRTGQETKVNVMTSNIYSAVLRLVPGTVVIRGFILQLMGTDADPQQTPHKTWGEEGEKRL